MKIRKATKKDVESCLEIQEDVTYWNKSDFLNSLKDKNVIFLVAEENNKVIGFIIGYRSPSKKEEVMIHETQVRKTERGKGFGTKLVNEFCSVAFKRGAKNVYALIDKKLKKFYINLCKFKISHNWIEAKKAR